MSDTNNSGGGKDNDQSNQVGANELITRQELHSCLGEFQANVEKVMIEYKSDVDSAILEFNIKAVERQSSFVKWMVGTTIATLLGVLGILIALDQGQDTAYFAGYETRDSHKKLVDAVSNDYQNQITVQNRSINELKNQVALLIKIQANNDNSKTSEKTE